MPDILTVSDLIVLGIKCIVLTVFDLVDVAVDCVVSIMVRQLIILIK